MLASCFVPAYSDATRCGPASECPTGRSCVQGQCLLLGLADAGNPDGSAGVGDGGTVLTVEKAGAGTGRIVAIPTALDCDVGCTATSVPVPSVASITLVATPQPGSYFAGWTGPCSGIRRTCRFQPAAVTVVARFEPQPGNLIFVTSERWTANFGGAGVADADCKTLAADAGLGGTWVALVSETNNSARSRLLAAKTGLPRGFVGMDGQAVADTVDDLLGNRRIWYPIRFDETGSDQVAVRYWTGSNPDGTTASSDVLCSEWMSLEQFGQTGGPAGGPLASGTAEPCSETLPLLCVETDLDVAVLPAQASGARIWISKTPLDPRAGIAAADTLCRDDRPPGVTNARAMLGTTTQTPGSVLSPQATYVRPDGIVIGTGQDILDGTQASAIWVKSDGSSYLGTLVWSGSNAIDSVSSSMGLSCNDWTSWMATGEYTVPSIAPGWFQGVLAQDCKQLAPCICVEQ
jgi:hypothetical protein